MTDIIDRLRALAPNNSDGNAILEAATSIEYLRKNLQIVEAARKEEMAKRDAATVEIERLRAEVERERMRLAACGVVALSDTPESAAKARDMHDDYKSASCDDVARRVDECMALRAEIERLRAECLRLSNDMAEAMAVLLCVEQREARLRSRIDFFRMHLSCGATIRATDRSCVLKELPNGKIYGGLTIDYPPEEDAL